MDLKLRKKQIPTSTQQLISWNLKQFPLFYGQRTAKVLISKQLSWIYPVLTIKTGFGPEIIIGRPENSSMDFYLKVGNTLIGPDLRRLLAIVLFKCKSVAFK